MLRRFEMSFEGFVMQEEFLLVFLSSCKMKSMLFNRNPLCLILPHLVSAGDMITLRAAHVHICISGLDCGSGSLPGASFSVREDCSNS